MMRRRTTGILLALTLCAGLAYGLVPDQAEEKEQRLYRLDEEETVRTVKLENDNGALQFFKGSDGNWMVKEEREFRADQQKLKLLTEVLADFPITRVLEEEKEAYGLSETDARAKVLFTTSSGAEHEFLVGGDTMTKNHVYIKDLDTGQTVITEMASVAQLGGGLGAFRSRKLFSVDMERIVGITLKKQGEKTLSLKFGGDGWNMEEPYAAPARQIELSEFLADMKDWNVYGFADTSVMGEAEMGLSGGGSFLTLKDSAGAEQTLEIGTPSGTVVPVRSGGKDDIYLLYADEVDLGLLDADKLLFFAPLKAGVDDIAGITVDTGDQTFEVQVDAEAGIFTCNGRPADPEAFYSFYVSYIAMTAQGRAPDIPEQDAQTEAVLTTTWKDGRTTQLRLLWRDDQTCHMIVNNSLSGFCLNREKLDTLKKKLERLGGY